jgi:hypothetical protein
MEFLNGIDYKSLIAPYSKILLTYFGFVLVVVMISWGFFGTVRKLFKLSLNSRVKSFIPLVIGIGFYMLASQNTLSALHPQKLLLYKKIAYGLVLGAISTSAYDLVLHKITMFLEKFISDNKGKLIKK